MIEGREHITTSEKLTDEEMGNLIAAFGNNEAKAITLLAMGDGRIYGSGDLRRAVLSAQGETIAWRMGTGILFNYCSYSLAPIGLVVRGLINPDNPDSHWGYQLTEDGKNKGIPLCGLFLGWSRRHKVSLYKIFGNTGSSSPLTILETKGGEEIEFRKRAPITTLRILYEIVTSPNLPVRLADIATGLPEAGRNIVGHLERLSKAGLIEYRAIEANQPFSAYKLASSSPPDELPIYTGRKSLTHAVFSVLQENPGAYLTGEEIYNLLPQELKEKWIKRPNSYSHITGILSHLTRNKYAEIEQFHSSLKSEINLTDDQRIILAELLEIIDRFQDQDPEIVTRGRGLAEEIINNSSAVSALLRRAKEASPNANRSLISETKELVHYLISSNPGITNKEIQDLLEKEGKKLGNERIAQLTSMLLGEGSISITQKGSVKKFFPRTSSGDV